MYGQHLIRDWMWPKMLCLICVCSVISRHHLSGRDLGECLNKVWNHYSTHGEKTIRFLRYPYICFLHHLWIFMMESLHHVAQAPVKGQCAPSVHNGCSVALKRCKEASSMSVTICFMTRMEASTNIVSTVLKTFKSIRSHGKFCKKRHQCSTAANCLFLCQHRFTSSQPCGNDCLEIIFDSNKSIIWFSPQKKFRLELPKAIWLTSAALINMIGSGPNLFPRGLAPVTLASLEIHLTGCMPWLGVGLDTSPLAYLHL